MTMRIVNHKEEERLISESASVLIDAFNSLHRGGRSGFGGPEFGNNRYFGGISDANTKIESVSVEDLLCDPGRKTRPEHLVVIFRGLPGSGKSHVAKLLKVNDCYL